MEDCWPSSVGLRGQALNHPVLRWLKTVVVSDRDKARRDRVRWGPGRRTSSVRRGRPGRASLLKHRNGVRRHRNRGSSEYPRDEPGGRPVYWPGGVRCRGGVSPVCGSCTEREKASVDTVGRSRGQSPPGRERERAEAQPKALSTEASFAGGPARRCAGINRHGGGDGRALHRRSSEPR